MWEAGFGSSITHEIRKAIGRLFRNGTLKQELVQASGWPDMTVLAVIRPAYECPVQRKAPSSVYGASPLKP